MEKTSPKSEVIAISLSDLPEDVEFKKNVCYPYFKDIFKVRGFKLLGPCFSIGRS